MYIYLHPDDSVQAWVPGNVETKIRDMYKAWPLREVKVPPRFRMSNWIKAITGRRPSSKKLIWKHC